MHPLSVFPSLLEYSQFAPFILRIALAVVLFMTDSLLLLRGCSEECNKISKIIQILLATLLILGLFIQPVAMIIVLLIMIDTIITTAKKANIENSILKFLIIAISLSLILLGPGLFSLDLPL